VAAKDYRGTMERLLAHWEGPLESECAVEEGWGDATQWTSIEVLVLAPRVWSRESHLTFSQKVRDNIRLFLLVNARMMECKLGRDVLQHLFQFFVCDESWAPVFRLHQCVVRGWVRPRKHPMWALNKDETPKPVSVDCRDCGCYSLAHRMRRRWRWWRGWQSWWESVAQISFPP
jgi:hypothetical protein